MIDISAGCELRHMAVDHHRRRLDCEYIGRFLENVFCGASAIQLVEVGCKMWVGLPQKTLQ